MATTAERVARLSRATTALVLGVTLALPCTADAQASATPAGDGLRVAYAPKAWHVTNDPDYVDWNHVVAFEWLSPRHAIWSAERAFIGLSLFDNSYGQFSQSVYAGLEWDWKRALGGNVFLALSAGLVHGYKEPWADKLPFNQALGVGLALVPSIGWQRDRFGLAASLSGSAIVLRASITFDR